MAAGHPSKNVALVTGAARRIGRTIALALAQDGWDIGVHHTRHSRAEALETVAAVQALGRNAVALTADFASEAAMRALVSRCAEKLGAPTCLVNNASLFEEDRADSFSHAALMTHMKINCAAPVLLAQALHDLLPVRARGVVINLLDQKLWNPNPDFLSYTLSKAALKEATTLLAQALAPRVRVVAVAPGITLPSGDQTAAGFRRAHRKTPLGSSSSPKDVAAAVAFLARARSVTGSALLVDGGQHLVASPRDVMFMTESR